MTEAYHLNALPKGKMLQESEVLRVLGEGSFGILYLAKGRHLGEHAAIKEHLPKELATRAGDTSVAPTSSSSERDFLWGRRKFLKEARRRAEAKAQRQAELDAQRQAAAEAQRQAALEARRQVEAGARRLAEQEAVQKAEAQSQRLSKVEAFATFLFAAKNTNVRTAPSIDSDKPAMIAAGSRVRITGGLPDGSWYRVGLAKGIDGFVWAKLRTGEPPAMGSTSEPAGATTTSVATPPAPGSGTPSRTAGSGASTPKAPADPKGTQEAIARPVPDPGETRRRIAELERFIDANPRDAGLAFRDYAARENILDHAERFRRVISFEDISCNSPHYRISVHCSNCYLKYGCQVLSDSGVFAALFDGGKLAFLGKADAPNQ